MSANSRQRYNELNEDQEPHDLSMQFPEGEDSQKITRNRLGIQKIGVRNITAIEVQREYDEDD